jgi:hypothetical protein
LAYVRTGSAGISASCALPYFGLSLLGRLTYPAMEIVFLRAVFAGDQKILRKGINGVSDWPIVLVEAMMDQVPFLEQFNEAMPNLFERRSVELDDLIGQVPDNSFLNKVRLHIPSVSTE